MIGLVATGLILALASVGGILLDVRREPPPVPRLPRPGPARPPARRVRSSVAHRSHRPLRRTSGKARAAPPTLTEHDIERAHSQVDENLLLAAGATGLGAAALVAPPLLVPSGVLSVLAIRHQTLTCLRELPHTRAVRLTHLDTALMALCLITGNMLAAGINVLAVCISRKLTALTRNRSRASLAGAFEVPLDRVYVKLGEVELEKAYADISAGDVVVIRAGEVVPVDGEVVAGEGLVDQHTLTGESLPVERRVGGKVLAASLLVRGRLEVRTRTSGTGTVAGQIARVLQQTGHYEALVRDRGEALGDQFVPYVFGLSVLAGPFVGPYRTAALLNTTPGVYFRAVAPIAMLRTLHRAAETGVLIKDGRVLDLLAEVDTVVFDKTGTLTEDRLEIGDIQTFGATDRRAVLAAAAVAEWHQTHPIARAIVAQAEAEGIDPSGTAAEISPSFGLGIRVNADGREILVGSRRFLAEAGIADESPEPEPLPLPEATTTAAAAAAAAADGPPATSVPGGYVHVAIDGRLAGAIELRPRLRPEVTGLIAALHERGLRTLVVSGDQPAATGAVARAVGIGEWHGEMLPEAKAALVDRLQAEGRRVCFVGDGINDAVALKRSSVSISLQGATTVARDAAQIVLLRPDLSLVGTTLDLAQGYDKALDDAKWLTLGAAPVSIASVFGLGAGVVTTVALNQLSLFASLGRVLNEGRPGAPRLTRRSGRAGATIGRHPGRNDRRGRLLRSRHPFSNGPEH